MPQQVLTTLENNFIGGLKTDNNPLNFPENACTDTDNCVFTVTGQVDRRAGINYETNFALNSDINRQGVAVSSYLWKNASGDGLTQIYVLQIGSVLTFYEASAATTAGPLSTRRLATSVNLSNFVPVGSGVNPAPDECQYSDGNGYLFVFHPACDPIYCTLVSGVVTGNVIPVKIRDFLGVNENVPVNFRPPNLSAVHNYNLNNQGWTSGATWGTFSSSVVPATTGSHTFIVDAGLPVVIGQQVAAADSHASYLSGTVTAYAGTSLTINVYASSNPSSTMGLFGPYGIESRNTSLIANFQTAIGSYPSNADIWWTFKNASNVFDPATTASNVTLSLGNAPKGHFVLDAFNQLRAAVASVPGIDNISTVKRPKTGTWFQGRVWYAGVDASVSAVGNAPYYPWTESIYFSQTVISSNEFGLCYQNNDPTSEDFFDLLPTDGGVIQIQGCGSVHKLFPIQNGLLVFASNGVWFITGSQGIGFAANDYTVTQISGVRAISGNSFINVQGFPIFWNEDGIYVVSPSQQGGGLVLTNLCLNTIQTFYNDVPQVSKRFARGDYNPLTYVVSWVFKSDFESDVSTRYEFDRVLTFNTSTKAFYPYTISDISDAVFVHDIKYVAGAGGGTSAPSVFKYLSSANRFQFTFSEEHDNVNWVDFKSYNNVGGNYISDFTTGYKLHGQGLTKFQPVYVNMFSNGDDATAYKIQGIWDFANSGNSGRYSNLQYITNAISRFGFVYRRHKIRGRGMSLQLKVISADGLPFSIIGWSTMETKNASV